MIRARVLSDMSRWTGALALVIACEGPVPRVTEARVPDKSRLYGDPALVPTRAGERAREELALAGSVVAALRARGGEGALAVEVRLPGAGDPGAAVVTGSLALDAASVVRIAEGVLGAWSVGRVQVELARAEASEAAHATGVAVAQGPAWGPGSWQGWLLATALLGFGVSAGVSIERLRQRRG